MFGSLPPLSIIVGHYLGYTIGEEKPKDMEAHAADLISKIMGGAR